MKVKTKVMICISLVIILNLITYINAYTHIDIYLPILVRYGFLLFFYFLQVILLFYVIKMKNRFIYFFPLYWGIEIWRLIFNTVVRLNLFYLNNSILEFIYMYITGFFWASDCFPYMINHMFSIIIDDFPYKIISDDIAKLVLSFIALIVSIKFSLLQYNEYK